MKGKVKWYNKEKGYGFITNVEGVDHFFNADSVRGTSFPDADDVVKFQSISGNKGMRAVNVGVLKQALEVSPDIQDATMLPGTTELQSKHDQADPLQDDNLQEKSPDAHSKASFANTLSQTLNKLRNNASEDLSKAKIKLDTVLHRTFSSLSARFPDPEKKN